MYKEIAMAAGIMLSTQVSAQNDIAQLSNMSVNCIQLEGDDRCIPGFVIDGPVGSIMKVIIGNVGRDVLSGLEYILDPAYYLYRLNPSGNEFIQYVDDWCDWRFTDPAQFNEIQQIMDDRGIYLPDVCFDENFAYAASAVSVLYLPPGRYAMVSHYGDVNIYGGKGLMFFERLETRYTPEAALNVFNSLSVSEQEEAYQQIQIEFRSNLVQERNTFERR